MNNTTETALQQLQRVISNYEEEQFEFEVASQAIFDFINQKGLQDELYNHLTSGKYNDIIETFAWDYKTKQA